MPTEPRRILVVRNRFVGDAMLAVPFLRNLRRRFPRAVIEVLCEAGSTALLAGCPHVDGVLPWKRPPRIGGVVWGSFLNLLWQAWRLRGRRYDRAYLLKRSLSSALLAWLAGIPCRIGFRSSGSRLLSRVVPIVPHRHQVELFLDLLRCEGLAIDDGHNEHWTSPETLAKADALLAAVPRGRRRVFVAPRSTADRKRWPLDRLARVIDWLVADRGCEVFLCGSPRDQRVHAALLRLVDPDTTAHVHDHSGALSLAEVGGLLARMDLCLGIDTGLTHVAAAHGVPVVVLVGPSDPNRWHPWGVPGEVLKGMHALRTDHGLIRGGEVRWNPDPVPMEAIPIGHVIDAVDRLLAGRPAPARRVLETIDLRQGAHRYEVWASPRQAAAAAEPATKPLAHAH